MASRSTENEYLAWLKRVKPDQKFFDFSPYKLQEVDSQKKGKKEVLFGLCRALHAG